MFRFLLLLFLAGAVVEIASIIWVGTAIGVISTVLLLAAGAILGVTLFRSAGANASAVLRSSIQDQHIYESLAGTTMTRILAGLLFLIPGFFSDLLGFLLLVLPVNRWLGTNTKIIAAERAPSSQRRDHAGPVIDGEAVEITGTVDREQR
jgi:UPF0716 protein FxsA